jgi:phage tail-like protein
MGIGDTTNIGLANRFVVTVVDKTTYDLGSWQKADGLDVTWDMPDYRAGDSGNARWYFPANTKYTSVKLMRAACDDSIKVRNWLNSNSFNWSTSRVTAVIKLYDSSGTIVIIEWELRHAQPKKWSINNMDAGASQISVETLELEHMGFLDDEVKIGEGATPADMTSWS